MTQRWRGGGGAVALAAATIVVASGGDRAAIAQPAPARGRPYPASPATTATAPQASAATAPQAAGSAASPVSPPAAASSPSPAATSLPSPGAPASAATAGALAGLVLLPGPRALPAAGAAITVVDPVGGTRSARTGRDGRFALSNLAAGPHLVTAIGAGGEQAERVVPVEAGRTASATLRLETAVGAGEVVVVRGRSEAERRRQSAEAVTVVETERARRQAADLGEVLARTQGVGVRRGGGLGSSARLSLGGLTDDQLRFFLDGVPLELAGYPFGIANVPVDLVERIEVYSGVVPVRFGADALGGGVNLVADADRAGTHGGASYEAGSFGTDRIALAVRHHAPESGLFARADGFFDRAVNDYRVQVELADAEGQIVPATVRRFHDGYRAAGGGVEVGVLDRPWARRLSLRAFGSDFDKDYQHDQAMNRAFGEVTYGESSVGGTARYDQPLGAGLAVEAVAGYAFTRGHFLDVATCSYDWLGRCIEGSPGETDTRPHDQMSWDHAAFARVNLGWTLPGAAGPAQALRLSLAPTYGTRTGRERERTMTDGRDPLSAERGLFSIVTGLEHELDLLGDDLENIAFAKHYAQRLDSEEPRPGDTFRRQGRTTQRFGVGDGLRYRVRPWLLAKASYEWAARLPRPDEVFGDNAFVSPNLELAPETSHNLNLGVAVEGLVTPAGALRASATGFVRDASDLVVLLGDERTQSYQNVHGARSVGVEAAAEWTSPGDWVVLDGTLTYQDLRNDSPSGAFGSFDGDRIPNRPFLFGGGGARLQLGDLVTSGDEVSASVTSRYVREYFRGWESVGLRDRKDTIPSQLVHSIGLGYLVRGERATASASIEVQNLTDQATFDFFGVQRPGRALYAKTTVQF